MRLGDIVRTAVACCGDVAVGQIEKLFQAEEMLGVQQLVELLARNPEVARAWLDYALAGGDGSRGPEAKG